MAKKLTEKEYRELIPQQIGCGYCHKENTCLIRDRNINKAKLGCPEFKHFLEVKKS